MWKERVETHVSSGPLSPCVLQVSSRLSSRLIENADKEKFAFKDGENHQKILVFLQRTDSVSAGHRIRESEMICPTKLTMHFWTSEMMRSFHMWERNVGFCENWHIVLRGFEFPGQNSWRKLCLNKLNQSLNWNWSFPDADPSAHCWTAYMLLCLQRFSGCDGMRKAGTRWNKMVQGAQMDKRKILHQRC